MGTCMAITAPAAPGKPSRMAASQSLLPDRTASEARSVLPCGCGEMHLFLGRAARFCSNWLCHRR